MSSKRKAVRRSPVRAVRPADADILRMPPVSPEEEKLFQALQEMAEFSTETASVIFEEHEVAERHQQAVRNSVRCDLAAKLLREMNVRFMGPADVFDFIVGEMENIPEGADSDSEDIPSMFAGLAKESALDEPMPKGPAAPKGPAGPQGPDGVPDPRDI